MHHHESDSRWEMIGVSELEEQVYRRVLADPKVRAREHADALGCSVSRVRSALARLASLGLLRRDDTSTARYEPVEPLAGIGALLRERRSDLDQIEAASHDLSRMFAATLLRTEPRRLFEVIEGREATAARIHDLLTVASQEAVGIDTPPYVAADSAQVSDAELDLLRRGVRFRSLYASAVLDEPGLVARMQWMAEQGEQCRVLPQVPMKLLIVDRETAIVLLTEGAEGRPALSVVAARSELTRGLQAMFDQLWSHATPVRLGSTGRGRATAPVPDAERLLDMLAAGMKDESIARHLGISPRTLRRRIAGLLDALDATERFQAGVRAASRGWL